MVKMYRTRNEIRLDILKLCVESRRVTQIVYQCNLNFNIYKTHLKYLIDKGWIRKDKNLYTITDAGKGIVDYASSAMAIMA